MKLTRIVGLWPPFGEGILAVPPMAVLWRVAKSDAFVAGARISQVEAPDVGQGRIAGAREGEGK